MSEISFGNYKVYDGVITPARYNRLIDLLQRITLHNGLNYRVSRNAAGTTLVAMGGTTAGTMFCPFDVTTTPSSGGTYTATVRAGTVNQFLPSNNFDSFTLSNSDVVQVKVTALTDGAGITSCSLALDTDNAAEQVPTPNSMPTSVTLTVGVIVNAVWYRTAPCGSFNLVSQELYQVDKNPPANPGTLPYIPYYIWIPSSS